MTDDREVHYFRPSLERIKERIERINERGPAGTTPMIKLHWYGVSRAGRHVLRILPPWSAEREFHVNRDSHFDVPGSSSRWITCGRGFGSPCPICDACDTLAGAGATTDELKRYRAKERSFFNCIVRGQENEGIRTVEVPRFVVEERVIPIIARIGDITHPDHGTDIVIESIGKKYKIRLGDRGPMIPGDLTGEATRGILTHLPNLRMILGRAPGQWLHQEAEKAAQALLGRYGAPPTPLASPWPPLAETVTPTSTAMATPSAVTPKTMETLDGSITDVVDHVVHPDAQDKPPLEHKGWKELLIEAQGNIMVPGVYAKIIAAAQAEGVDLEEVAAANDAIISERLDERAVALAAAPKGT